MPVPFSEDNLEWIEQTKEKKHEYLIVVMGKINERTKEK